jgi:hypothetical protein
MFDLGIKHEDAEISFAMVNNLGRYISRINLRPALFSEVL